MSVNSQLQGETSQLLQGAKDAEQVSQGLTQMQRTMGMHMENLMGQLGSTISPALMAAHQNWHQKLTKVVVANSTLGENTQATANMYETTTEGARSSFSNLINL
ncbi:WXG100 family type VII secretion target [Amycolatopsis sp. H20-H5]|uniref:WXG100 family type VII secretion target n=1 Tax=Amycolatopsis sp. H20-H5 TaxID=3046309 RepID=UPI002DB9B8A5|nr:type VII secretion target [Amycolatopsis sp. H20-H5]MEC3982622.1 type VII secretion target [Amycolatopsis sp. H20-H5]